MKFVDRIDEAARLKDALAREKSSLVVMYGRRRLGKSTLIKRVLSDTDVYFLADRSEGATSESIACKSNSTSVPGFRQTDISGLGIYVSCGQLSNRQAFYFMFG